MRKFKDHIEHTNIMEMKLLSNNPDEYSFIKRVLSKTNLVFDAKDFENIKYKKIIQKLIAAKWFGKASDIKTSKGVNQKTIEDSIEKLKKIDKQSYNKLFRYKPTNSNPGPGEVLLYFLIDDAVLGGDSSKGVDLIVGNDKYEVKAAKHAKKENFLYGFQTGGTVDNSEMISKFLKLKKQIDDPSKTDTGVTKKDLDKIKKKFKSEHDLLLKDYQKRVYEQYFKDKKIIFFDSTKPPSTFGDIPPDSNGKLIAIMQVKQKDIGIYEIVGRGGVNVKVNL